MHIYIYSWWVCQKLSRLMWKKIYISAISWKTKVVDIFKRSTVSSKDYVLDLLMTDHWIKRRHRLFEHGITSLNGKILRNGILKSNEDSCFDRKHWLKEMLRESLL